jgi:transposase
MDHIIRIGMDTSKHVFQLHGVNAAEEPVLRRKLRRNDMVVFFERLAPTIIAIEAPITGRGCCGPLVMR